jgi:hypothetical protein
MFYVSSFYVVQVTTVTQLQATFKSKSEKAFIFLINLPIGNAVVLHHLHINTDTSGKIQVC